MQSRNIWNLWYRILSKSDLSNNVERSDVNKFWDCAVSLPEVSSPPIDLQVQCSNKKMVIKLDELLSPLKITKHLKGGQSTNQESTLNRVWEFLARIHSIIEICRKAFLNLDVNYAPTYFELEIRARSCKCRKYRDSFKMLDMSFEASGSWEPDRWWEFLRNTTEDSSSYNASSNLVRAQLLGIVGTPTLPFRIMPNLFMKYTFLNTKKFPRPEPTFDRSSLLIVFVTDCSTPQVPLDYYKENLRGYSQKGFEILYWNNKQNDDWYKFIEKSCGEDKDFIDHYHHIIIHFVSNHKTPKPNQQGHCDYHNDLAESVNDFLKSKLMLVILETNESTTYTNNFWSRSLAEEFLYRHTPTVIGFRGDIKHMDTSKLLETFYMAVIATCSNQFSRILHFAYQRFLSTKKTTEELKRSLVTTNVYIADQSYDLQFECDVCNTKPT